MGTLYIISTPIGNLEDISFRAVKKLFEVEAVACEDTRRTGILLKALTDNEKFHISAQFKPHLVSYYEQNEAQRIPEIISFLKEGHDMALVSDAGTPLISDPGFKLVRECVAEGIRVEAVPGASAVMTALTVSGLPTDKFTFAGYPPHKPGHRMKFFESIKSSQKDLNTTVILYEAPHKLLTTLAEMQQVFGDIEIVICRELTKIHEEVRHEKISQSVAHFKKRAPKGEIVILFHLI